MPLPDKGILRAGALLETERLPDNCTAALFHELADDPDIYLINVTREGEAFATAAGLWMGGQNPLVLIQNTGFLESGDALRGTLTRMRIPVVLLVSYRGYKSLMNPAPTMTYETAGPQHIEVEQFDGFGPMGTASLGDW